MHMSYFLRMEKVIRIQGGCISDWVSSLFRTRRVVNRVADPVFLHGSGSGFQISLDPVFNFSGSGFSPDSGKLQKGL